MSKTASLEELAQVIEPIVGEFGYSLVEVAWGTAFRRRSLTVFIDRPEGVDLDDCSKLSSQISQHLDEQELVAGSYVLEVSSPGAERPLKTEADYARFRGKYAKVQVREPLPGAKGTEYYGTLLGLTDGALELQVTDDQILRIPVEQILKARLAIKF